MDFRHIQTKMSLKIEIIGNGTVIEGLVWISDTCPILDWIIYSRAPKSGHFGIPFPDIVFIILCPKSKQKRSVFGHSKS